MLTPDINLKAINDKEAEGFYIETNKLKYEVDNSSFSSSVPIPDSVADNYNNIYVITKFRLGKQISIETKEFEEDYAQSISSKIFLRLDGRLQEKYVPKDVDFSWYKGEGKGIFTHSEFQNNEALDKRSEQEKEKGIVFDGWYADPQYKYKIEFKDGISTFPILGKMIYPKFVSGKWDKIRDIRHILDAVFTILATAANVAGVNDEIEKYSKPIEHGINIIKWIIFLALGGKMKLPKFWDGYQNINDLIFTTTKDKISNLCSACQCEEKDKPCKNEIYEALLWLSKDLSKNIFGIYQKYSKNKFKGTAFLESKDNLEDWSVENILGKTDEDAELRTKYLKCAFMCCCKDERHEKNGKNDKTEKFANALVGKSGILEIIKTLIKLIIDSVAKEINTTLLTTKIVQISVQLTIAIKEIVANKFWKNEENK
ncbi:hypothetical protein QLQ80_03030, partial [Mycoplasma sp. M5725]